MNDTWTDQRLVEAIRGGGHGREAALEDLFRRPGWRAAVVRHVVDHGGTADDAQDVFQESLVLLDRNVRTGRFRGDSSLSTYFVAIAKWHWLSLRRKSGRFTPLHDQTPEADPHVNIEQDMLRDEQRILLEQALEQLGDRCRDLLLLYRLDYSMREIAERLRYENADVAKKEAFRCRGRLRELLETDTRFEGLIK